MKFGVLILLFSTVAVAQTPAPRTQPAAPDPPGDSAQENSQKARKLINQAIQALGGQAYLNVQDMRSEGRTYSFYHGEANGVGTLFWRFWKWPDKDRIELTKQHDVIYIENGDKGYETTFKGTCNQNPVDLAEYMRQREYSLDYVLRRWFPQTDIALFYEGQTVADNRQVEKVTIMNSKNQAVSLYLDEQTHLPIKKSFAWRDADRYRNEDSEIYGEYHLIDGINTPFQVVREHNGEMSRQRFLTNVKYNTGIPDSSFDAKPTDRPDCKNSLP